MQLHECFAICATMKSFTEFQTQLTKFYLAPTRQCRRPLIEDELLLVRPSDQVLFNVGQSIWFSCEKPYTLVGRDDITCQADGEFNGPVPSCVGKG